MSSLKFDLTRIKDVKQNAVFEGKEHSDQDLNSLTWLADRFVDAHLSCPGGISIEVGTRRGGSALMFLKILEGLYGGVDKAPYLFTVDPYGAKPYKGGKIVTTHLYGDADYVHAKKVLSPYPNHVHWHLEGVDVLSLWSAGHPPSLWRVGQKVSTNVAFVFLDGDHDAETISRELQHCRGLRSSPLVVVDNVDADEETLNIRGVKYEQHRHSAIARFTS